MHQNNSIAFWIATWFKTGLWPKAPGTWGSLMSIPLAALIHVLFGFKGMLALICIGYIAGTLASYAVLKLTDDPDPSFIVIDEAVGQWLVLLAAGSNISLWCLSFVLFRIFDIVKPYPIHRVERYFAQGTYLSKAMGIMVDDIFAGGYAIIVLYVLRLVIYVNQ